MNLGVVSNIWDGDSIPRVSGDEPTDVRIKGINNLYSPRERG